MYCSLNSLVSCGNDVTWPSGRLMSQSIVVPTNVLMNSLHHTASEPPTNIICVRIWASRSSILVKVTLGPTIVAGITASMIACENGIENSLGVSQVLYLQPHVPLSDFADPCAIPHSIGTVLRLLLATQPTQEPASIVFIICCRVRLSPPFGATDPCLVFLIFLVLSSGTVF